MRIFTPNAHVHDYERVSTSACQCCGNKYIVHQCDAGYGWTLSGDTAIKYGYTYLCSDCYTKIGKKFIMMNQT